MLQQIKINGSKKWKFKLFVYLEKKTEKFVKLFTIFRHFKYKNGQNRNVLTYSNKKSAQNSSN